VRPQRFSSSLSDPCSWMEVSGQLHLPAAFPSVPIMYDSGCSPVGVVTFDKRQTSYLCREWDPVPYHPTRSVVAYWLNCPVGEGKGRLIQAMNVYSGIGGRAISSVQEVDWAPGCGKSGCHRDSIPDRTGPLSPWLTATPTSRSCRPVTVRQLQSVMHQMLMSLRNVAMLCQSVCL
jgi:hypothetical protein